MTTFNTVEEKVITKIRRVLIANTVIKGIVCTRIYGTHISSILKPEYPCISLHLANVNMDFSAREFGSVSVQIDIWLLKHKNDGSSLHQLVGAIRGDLDRQNLIDANMSLLVASIIEVNAGPTMDDPNEDLIHYPLIYTVVAK